MRVCIHPLRSYKAKQCDNKSKSNEKPFNESMISKDKQQVDHVLKKVLENKTCTEHGHVKGIQF